MDNKREYPRFSFSEPVGYQRREIPAWEGSLAQDISQAGLKLDVNEFIPLNTILDLQIRLPGQGSLINSSAKVVWVKEMPFRDDAWEIGLQLIPDAASSSALRDFINLHQFRSN